MNTTPAQLEVCALPIATVIRVSHGLYDHVGLIGDRFIMGDRSVLSFSAQAGGLVEQAYSAFAAGRTVAVNGYLGTLPPEIVMQRARLKTDQPYSWIGFNCEHFVRYAHGVPIQSPQLRQWGLIAGMLGFLTLATARS